MEVNMLSLQVNTKKKLLLGSIQLPSFLGKTDTEIGEISRYASENAAKFENKGFDGVFIQDTTPGRVSFTTVANLASVTRYVKEHSSLRYIGCQMECDEAEAILAVAKSVTCDMVRIKNYVGASVRSNGIVNGQGHEAIRFKTENLVGADILCDIFNIAGSPIGNLSLKQACRMALQLGASGLIICGHDFEETMDLLESAKSACPNAFILCGGNATIDNVGQILEVADGVIASTCLKTGPTWDEGKIEAFVSHARK